MVQTYTNECPTSSTYFPDCKLVLPVSVFGAFPHSHLLCTSLRNYAVNTSNPNDTIPLIRINRWDFHWQGFYTFKKLIKVPAGYKWISYHTYDNTVNNPNNPNNPPQTVIAGENTTDEMLFDSFMLLFYQNGDENLNIDSLLTVSVKEFMQSVAPDDIVIFPNPTEKFIHIITNPNLTINDISIYDVTGKRILTTPYSDPKLDISFLGTGLYYLEIKTSTGIFRRKIIKH